MSLLALLLQATTAAGHVAVPPAGPIVEATFDANRYCLPLANQRSYDLPKPDSHLVDTALANAESSGQDVLFHKALAKQQSGPAYYVFRLKRYFDIYLVYETDPIRKSFVRKFRYFSKYRACALPWPPAA